MDYILCVTLLSSAQSAVISWSIYNEYIGHFDALTSPRENVCFDEARTTKAWNYNPLFSSVQYFASTQGNMHPMMRDVVLGEKFPHSMFFDFSWLIALQST
jgi:hypothetical protein